MFLVMKHIIASIFLGITPLSFAQTLKDEGKIQVTVNQHKVHLNKDTLYEVNVTGEDFRAAFQIDNASFYFKPLGFRIADNAIRGTQGYVLVEESKEYAYQVWPASFPNMPSTREFAYQVTFHPRVLATKPLLYQESELTTEDPLHKTLLSKYKSFPVTIQPEQTVVIQVNYEKPTINPIIELESRESVISVSRARPRDARMYIRICSNTSKEEKTVQLVVASRDNENLGKFVVTARAAK